MYPSLPIWTVAVAAILYCNLPAHAQTAYPHRPVPPAVAGHPTGCAALEVGSQGRLLVPILFRQQLWIEGHNRAEYTLSVINQCPSRVLAVLSVDGLNVLTGNTASVNQGGYIVEPYGRITVNGWRKSLDQSAAFFFTYPANSYAARVGKDANLGVIGAAFFRERVPMRRQEDRQYGTPEAQSGTVQPSDTLKRERRSDAPAAAPSLGTGHGRRIDDAVTITEFERESYPFATIALRYETRAKLIAMGAIQRRSEQPSPFPADPAFVPDPPR